MNATVKDMIERRSVRKFKPDAVPQALVDEVIEAGLYAAQDNCRIGGWKEGFDPFYGAPVILMVLAPKDVQTAVEDGSLVLGNLMLAGHALGLGTIWINRAKEEFEEPYYKELLKKIGIEGEYIGVGHCVLGYCDGDLPKPPARHPNRVYYVS